MVKFDFTVNLPLFLTMNTLFILDGDLDLVKVHVFLQEASLQI